MANNMVSDQPLPDLVEVCKEGNHRKLEHLLKEYEAEMRSLRSCDHGGWQAVHYAVADLNDNHVKCLQLILSANVELIHEHTKENQTPIMIASKKGNINAVQKLLDLLKPQNLELMSIHQDNALMLALKYNREDVALLLLSRYTAAEFTNPTTAKERPINIACENKMTRVLQRLLDVGVPITVDGTNPVHVCCKVGWSEGLQLIIDHQKHRNNSTADDRPFRIQIQDLLSLKDGNQHAPLNLVCEQGSTHCASILFKEGISPLTSVGFPGKYYFAVTKAIKQRHRDLTKYLLTKITADDIDMICKERSEQRLYTAHPFACMSFDGSYESMEGWKFLIDCGFPLDLQHVPVNLDRHYRTMYDYEDTVVDQRSMLLSALGYVMSTGYDTDNPDDKSLAILELILEQGVTITPESIVLSCGEGKITSAHLLTLKYLSFRSQSEIQNVYNQVFVGLDGLVAPFSCNNSLDFELDNITYHISSSIAIQFILKGFSVKLNIDENTIMTASIDPAVLFLSDADKRQYLSSFPDISDHPLALCNTDFPSNLKSLCRNVIRRCLGSKLIREPVPQFALGPWFADPSWESSCIDKLPLPAILKDFVKFKDIMPVYSKHCFV